MTTAISTGGGHGWPVSSAPDIIYIIYIIYTIYTIRFLLYPKWK